MTRVSAGQFEVTVGDGYPYWVSVKTQNLNGDSVEFRFHHRALADLEYAISRARALGRHDAQENFRGEF